MTRIGRRSLVALPIALAASGARAQLRPLRIGVLTDESGPYVDIGGPGSILAARMAAQDTGDTVLGRPVEILHADDQNKPDIAAAAARRWYDEGVDAIVDLPVTPVALAVLEIARQRSRTVMITAAATSDITHRLCSPISTHWADDTHALTAGTAKAVVTGGGTTWFFITVDHTFGRALQRDATAVIEANGGRVLGDVRHPIGTTDFSAFLVQAQASGAQVIGLASVGAELINLIKQASEFGLLRSGGPTLVGFLTYISDIHGLGLPVAQNLTFASSFYWDQNDAARAWSARFFAAHRAMPTKNHAAIYTAVRHYLRAIQQAGTDDAVAVNRAMRAAPVDYLGRPASIRADGRVLYDLTLYRVKRPAESHTPWDYYAPIRTIPQAEAFLPINPACG